MAGPRQVGKTTLALALPGARRGYLNWDISEHREKILKNELPPGKLWIFDELHKYRRWRNYLKGIYDGRPDGQQILVTGSGRLDLYRFGGDSLQGRYHLLRLHPFSVAELDIRDRDGFDQLLRLGGFPEPFLLAADRLDDGRDVSDDIGLPHPDDATLLLESTGGAAVAGDVGFDLGDPVGGVGAASEALAAFFPVPAVPEVSVAEDDHARTAEDEIELAGERRVVEPETKAASPKLTAEEHLGPGVAGAVAALDRGGERGSRLKL